MTAIPISDATKQALHQTANALAPDILDSCEDNEEFVGNFLDSDYVTIYGSQEAGEEMIALIQTYGYAAVLKAVCELWQWK